MNPTPSTPLFELHRHLDGSLRPETVRELAASRGLEVPKDLPFFAGMGLSAALSRFDFTLSLLQQPAEVQRVASEMCEDSLAEGLAGMEIRFAPQLHRDAPIERIVDAALEGLAGRAGLILCALYGEDPSVLRRLVELARMRPQIVGIDLAGGPSPTHGTTMIDYKGSFWRAADLGIGRTVHAGEGRPPAEIRVAIEDLRALRVGHGTTILDDPSVVELALDRGITIEACLTSNHQVGAIPSLQAHPLPLWLDFGLKTCICADNTLLSETTLPKELRHAATLPGMSPEKIERCRQCARDALFHR